MRNIFRTTDGVFPFDSMPYKEPSSCVLDTVNHSAPPIQVRWLGQTLFSETMQAMQSFTGSRKDSGIDEIWVTEHAPVYTLGLSADPNHLLPGAAKIPVIRTDRGGQITCHAPGQLVVYLMLDLRARGLMVRELVASIENAIIRTLGDFNLIGHRLQGMPGVYIDRIKVAALGIKIARNRYSYHGLSLNIRMDKGLWLGIHPCGYTDIQVGQLSDWLSDIRQDQVAVVLVAHLQTCLGEHLGRDTPLHKGE